MRIVFYYPSHVLGGAELLFFRLARELWRRHFQVAYVDYRSGVIWNLVNSEELGVELIEYAAKPLENFNASDIIIIMPANFSRNLPLFVQTTDARLLFWVIHPLNLVPTLPLSSLRVADKKFFSGWLNKFLLREDRKNLKAAMNTFSAKNGLYFMDGSCYESHRDLLGLRESDIKTEKYIPVYLPWEFAEETANDAELVSVLRIAWLGRIDNSFKHFILEKVLRDLNELRALFNFEVLLIGSGEGVEYINAVCNECSKIKVNRINTVPPAELSSYLKKNVDLLFAMGTSALEGASMGVPTVCLDASYEVVEKNYLYRFLYQSRNFSLGYVLSKGKVPQENTFDMKGVLEKTFLNKEALGMKSKEFYIDYYAPDVVLNKFIKSAQSSSLIFSDVPKQVYTPTFLTQLWRWIRTFLRVSYK